MKGRREPKAPEPSKPPYVPCGNCVNGWVQVGSGREFSVERCWCWKKHFQSVDTRLLAAGEC